jgi:hypothetical protein
VALSGLAILCLALIPFGGTASAATNEFHNPSGIAAGDSHVWIANSSGNSVTELNAKDSSLVRVIH